MICVNCKTINCDENLFCSQCNAKLDHNNYAQDTSLIERKDYQRISITEANKPTYFTYRKKLLSNLLGLLFLGGVFFLLYLVTKNRENFYSPYLVLLTTVCIAYAIFSPLFTGDAQAERYFKKNKDDLVGQITFNPRKFTGLEAILDDADDLGLIKIMPEKIIFIGEGMKVEIVKEDIKRVVFQPSSKAFVVPKSFIGAKALLIEVIDPNKYKFSSCSIFIRMGISIFGYKKHNKTFCLQAQAFINSWLQKKY